MTTVHSARRRAATSNCERAPTRATNLRLNEAAAVQAVALSVGTKPYPRPGTVAMKRGRFQSFCSRARKIANLPIDDVAFRYVVNPHSAARISSRVSTRPALAACRYSRLCSSDVRCRSCSPTRTVRARIAARDEAGNSRPLYALSWRCWPVSVRPSAGGRVSRSARLRRSTPTAASREQSHDRGDYSHQGRQNSNYLPRPERPTGTFAECWQLSSARWRDHRLVHRMRTLVRSRDRVCPHTHTARACASPRAAVDCP